ncbi:MAG: type I-E CRISPR-associated protein Cse2/CasB, partial [Pontiellaceae bacterium]|nr:type I-E CRISPR-associated protein Cse2/CasB [Pontiellaceae bacterium]
KPDVNIFARAALHLFADTARGCQPLLRAWPHIAPYCNLDVEWSRLPVQTVCAAFASQPEYAKSGNLGSTLRRLKEAMASAEGRFERLLTCDTKEELCTRLPAIIRAAKAKGIPVNYQQLYCDICWWEVADIKVRWAAAFWGTGGGDA